VYSPAFCVWTVHWQLPQVSRSPLTPVLESALPRLRTTFPLSLKSSAVPSLYEASYPSGSAFPDLENDPHGLEA
jgi:hypothetical protein